MRNYAQRRHDWAKHAIRRRKFFRTVVDARTDYENGKRDSFAPNLATFRFLCTDTRLLILYHMFRECELRREFKWFGYQHTCPCPQCRGHFGLRKSNSLRQRSIQSRRELLNAPE